MEQMIIRRSAMLRATHNQYCLEKKNRRNLDHTTDRGTKD